MSKRCPLCGETKPLDEFHRQADNQDGRKCCCKECMITKERERNKRPERKKAIRNSNRRRLYGLSPEAAQQMWEKQDGRCGLCHELLDWPGSVDHDHQTGQVRSLLHPMCNSLLGFAYEDPNRLKKALSYLEAHSG